MKKLTYLIIIVFLLSGCATYEFHRGKAPYDKGYIVTRDDKTILEYTIGKDNSVPNLKLARERFKKRRSTVEFYYKKMGYIDNRLVETFWEPVVLMVKLVGGIFRLPFIAISDYKYEHNPQYREKIRKILDERDAKEEARIKKFKEELNFYIQEELAKERP